MSELYGLVGSLQRALDYHLNRQTVLSSNLANVDTPGFRPLELLRPEANDPGRPLRMAETSERHLGNGAETGEEDFVRVEDRASPPGADGNSVDLDWEMSKLAANHLRYETTSKIVSRQLGLLRYAATGGNG